MHRPLTLSEVFLNGGPVMWPLLGASVVGMAVVLERCVHYSRRRLRFEQFVDEMAGAVGQGDETAARAALEGKRSPIARLAGVFVDVRERPRVLREELLRREGGILLEEVERRLPLLRLVVQIAPILGLLGTVHGLLLAFWALEAINGPIRPSDVAGGIGSALTTTVFGLCIAIPASGFLLLFEEHVDRVARRMGFLVSHLEEALLQAESEPKTESVERRAG